MDEGFFLWYPGDERWGDEDGEGAHYCADCAESIMATQSHRRPEAHFTDYRRLYEAMLEI